MSLWSQISWQIWNWFFFRMETRIKDVQVSLVNILDLQQFYFYIFFRDWHSLESFATTSFLCLSSFLLLDVTFYMTRHTVNIALCFDKSHFRFTFATITTRVAQWSDVASGRSIFRDKERLRRVLRWKKSTIPMFLLYALSGGQHIRDSKNVRSLL